MSASDSGLIILAAPVVLTVGAVSLAAAGISAAAQHYKQFRFDEASAREMEKRAHLEFVSSLAEQNRKEYEAIMEERALEEADRRAGEARLLDSARNQVRDELLERERIAAEIRIQIEHLGEAVQIYEAEFGPDFKLREMAETIYHSRELFGDGTLLLSELHDLLFVILPGMTEEKREQINAQKLGERFDRMAAEHLKITDSSQDFISLHTGMIHKKAEIQGTPWERFMARLEAVAKVEEQYFETAAQEMLEEAEAVAPGRQNFFIQQHQNELLEMEERAEEYRSLQKQVSQEGMDAYCMYLAMTEKLGIEPSYTQDDLTDDYLLHEMREETEKLAEEYKRRRERQYTVNAFTVVMNRHNLVFVNMDVNSFGLEEVEYSMDEQTGVRITRAQSGAFEMQFQGKSKGANASLDEERSITEKAKHFCSLLPSITKELEEEFGITFEQTALQPPRLENIEIRQNRQSSRMDRRREQKAMQMK
ncbi:MAG: hypothetical protein IJI24_02005 [Lachnospiraceae bacterium]|nr:hypothetical protein [Lachnospiraceae bacterium]